MLNITNASGKPFIRSSPELGHEIGDKPAALLLQLEYWIRTSSTELIDGKRWTYQSTREIKDKAFPSWGVATINRTINRLKELGLIEIGNYNKRKYDRTRWFALNAEGVKQLKSITLMEDGTHSAQNGTGSAHFGTRSDQNGTGSNHFGTRSAQNGTPIPMTPTVITALTPALTPAPAPHAAAGLVQSQSSDAVVDEKPKAAVKVETVEAAKVDIQETPTTPATTPIPPVPVTPLSREWSADDCDEPGMAGLRQFFTGCRDADLKQLVAKYGLAAIEQTIEAVRQLPNVENPPGLVKHKLHVNAVAHWVYPKVLDQNDAKRYLSGEYASFIRH